jgi:hypothetical protein
MDRMLLIERLLAAPAEIALAEELLLGAEEEAADAARRLQEREDRLLLAGDIDGRNAEARAAQLRALTEHERQTVERHEGGLRWAKRNLHLALNQFAALRAVARLLDGAEQPR